MSDAPSTPASFADFGLADALLTALNDVGYETPTPIQSRTIPPLLEGRDVLGQAPTGTGKTAAFALPILHRVELSKRSPQVLVLTPTRELALQVAEAFQRYAKHLPGLHVLPVYGGQAYPIQLRALQRGVHVLVGTPGRVMDHMRRGSLKVDGLRTLVLDEADEMLRMGFVEDVTWILEQTPPDRQIALFSATMPAPIQRIADRHLRDPVHVRFQVRPTAADTIHQRYWVVGWHHKLEALTRFLEVETFEAMLIFVRTKTAAVELAEKLEARGYAAAPLNGDIPQAQRERTVNRLRHGHLDILVATDVAARGLDVERISHVINYDIPSGSESYVHRIGRTGRAGRTGEALLFVAPRERRMLHHLERAIGHPIEAMRLPTTKEVNKRRIERFKQRLRETLQSEDLTQYKRLMRELVGDGELDPVDVAAALAHLAQGDQPLLAEEIAAFEQPQGGPPKKQRPVRPAPAPRQSTRAPTSREARDRPQRREDRPQRREDRPQRREDRPQRREDRPERPKQQSDGPERRDTARDKRKHETRRTLPVARGMERFRIDVGHSHGMQPRALVDALTCHAGLDRKLIGRIDIGEAASTIELPQGMPREIFRDLAGVIVCDRPLRIQRVPDGKGPPDRKSGSRKG